MNRSRQRTSAISWAIAAGVFCAGIAGIAPASADSKPNADGGSAQVGSAGDRRGGSAGDRQGGSAGDRQGGSAGDRQGGSAGDRRGGSAGDRSGLRAGARERVTADLPRSGGVESGRAEVSVPEVSVPEVSVPGGPEQHWPWPPCHSEWPVWPVPVPVPAAAASPSRGIRGVPPPITQPTVTFGPSVSRLDPPGLQLRAALRLRIAERIRERRERSDQALPSGPAPFRPAPLAPIPPPAAPLKLGPRPAAPVPQPAESPAARPESNRAGYPAYLRDADLAEVAAVAVPGLVGIFGLTAIGGYLGFRQARAGYILRAAGTARFLR